MFPAIVMIVSGTLVFFAYFRDGWYERSYAKPTRRRYNRPWRKADFATYERRNRRFGMAVGIVVAVGGIVGAVWELIWGP